MDLRSFALAAALIIVRPAIAADIASEFAKPPMSARPWTYYWFEGGYASPEGLSRDLSEMRRMGIGGFLHMQTVNVTGIPVPSEPKMLSPEWASWFGDLAAKAKANGLTMAASCIDGWGMGGWWIGPEHAAKRLVHTEVQLDGPTSRLVLLPQPAENLGLYRDIAVVAFRERPHRPVTPAAVAASSAEPGYCGEQNWPPAHAADLDPTTFWRASQGAISSSSPALLTVSFHSPVAATRALIVAAPSSGPAQVAVDASQDGVSFAELSRADCEKGAATELTFPETRARHFRLRILSAHAPDVGLAEFVVLRSGDNAALRPGIRYWEFKAGIRGFWLWPPQSAAALAEEHAGPVAPDFRPSEVVDLTGRMRADGSLDWSPGDGRWTIMRFGWVPLGQPARMASAPGLEADVLSTAAADQLFTCAERMLEVTETAAPGTLRAFHTDSWEIGADVAGVQPNWTDDFREQFRKRRGYDILTYLPALTGRIATDRETTNRFLWDVRATIADLIAGFYGRLQQRAHARGCLVNPESGYGTYPHPHIDGLQVFGRADIPMAEFWHHNDIMSRSASFADALRNAASGARIYGRRVVQAEALTFAPLGGPPTAPWRYRKTLNRAYVDGLNQAVIHKIVHQPFEFKPGLEDYGILGRHYTWWPMADGLLGYMGRCQTMLQQGLFVADACYYVGEGGSTYVCGKEYLDPPLHAGRDFDGINAEVLSTRLAVRNGRLTLPGGLSYRVLVLPAGKSWTVRPVVLERILHLVRAGATVLGHRPRRAPGLTDRARQDARVRSLADRLWGREVSPRGIRRVGKGRVVWGLSPEALFRHDGLPPDFEVTFDRHRASLAGASWIWHPDDGTNAPACERLFRSTLLVPAGRRVARASAILTADNAFTLWVNGRPVAMGDDWAQTVSVALTGALRQGANAVEIRAKNTVEGPAGLIASFSAVLDDASSVTLATGPDWRASTDGTAWTTARVVAQYGAGPWGRPDSSPDIRHIHRQTADGTDVYFVANMGDVPVDAALRFRVTGRRPEYWDPLTGRTRDLTDWRVEQGRTVVPFRFEGAEGGFFVFRRAARPSSVQRPNSPTEAPLLELAGPWIVRFDPAWGGPARVEFAALADWTVRPEDGIRHYSGIATYELRFDAPRAALATATSISLGQVREVARVRVNGRDIGPVWCAPWRVEVPKGLLRPRGNLLEVDVANLWDNRLIKDAQLPPVQRLTRGTYTKQPTDPLLASGLLGPVRLLAGTDARSP